MFAYILRRIGQSILVMAAVSLISFSLFNFVGDPVNNMVGQEASREDRLRIRQQLGLDDPIFVQYFRFVGNAVKGEFGLSYRVRRPVDELIKERLPATLELVAYHRHSVNLSVRSHVTLATLFRACRRRRAWLVENQFSDR